MDCVYKKECEAKGLNTARCHGEITCGIKNMFEKMKFESAKEKILITGHKGLIGSALHKLFSEDYKVYGVDRGDKIKNIKYDYIIHCAANCVIREVISDPSLMKENIDYTYQILEFARNKNIKKVIMFSSGRVSHPNLHNPYIASKKVLEDMTKAYNKCYGIDYMLIRPETIWGANESDVRVMRQWIYKAKRNKPIVVFGSENKKLSPLYIDSFVHVFKQLFYEFESYKNSAPYTISGNGINCKDIINTIKNFYHSSSDVIYGEPEKEQPQDVLEYNDDYRQSVNLKHDLERFEEAMKE